MAMVKKIVLGKLSAAPRAAAVLKLSGGGYAVGRAAVGDEITPAKIYPSQEAAWLAMLAADREERLRDEMGSPQPQWQSTGTEGALDDGPS